MCALRTQCRMAAPTAQAIEKQLDLQLRRHVRTANNKLTCVFATTENAAKLKEPVQYACPFGDNAFPSGLIGKFPTTD